ncbi:interleukin-12 subunit alpha isoform X2 [Nerophis ophidion]|uniref:interleukin-12 subunit alpha isoform X2 n=1 Tax=Nerophis ophidion TaxID=159077 RepID=UPI002AE08C18|nr:interleukin-12 subunit alpha isoform X2 [Nerophis ophidion]
MYKMTSGTPPGGQSQNHIDVVVFPSTHETTRATNTRLCFRCVQNCSSQLGAHVAAFCLSPSGQQLPSLSACSRGNDVMAEENIKPAAGLMSCLLLTSTLQWRTCTSLPARHPSAPNSDACPALFRSLLLNITELVKSEILWHGITSETDAVSSPSDTVRACAPNIQLNSSCMINRNSSFSKSECLLNMKKDLLHYQPSSSPTSSPPTGDLKSKRRFSSPP